MRTALGSPQGRGELRDKPQPTRTDRAPSPYGEQPEGLAFRTALGYRVVDHREDLQHGRPCTVLRKNLTAP
ncbi:hypothetical protein ACIP39_24725 [Streptomyces tibetensis]|uniref:hypothetical protein n=1 Tax=Streptomyces tibetensis TaxID=2382123 RepID=UPI00380E7D62